MLNRIKMTSNPGAERQGQVNSGNKFSGSSLWALTHCHTHSGQLSSLPGDKEGPNVPMQAELHSVIPRTISCWSVQGARSAQLKVQDSGQTAPLLWWKRKAIGEITELWETAESGKRTLAQPGGLGFHFGQQTRYNPDHIAELSGEHRFYSQDTREVLPFPAFSMRQMN